MFIRFLRLFDSNIHMTGELNLITEVTKSLQISITFSRGNLYSPTLKGKETLPFFYKFQAASRYFQMMKQDLCLVFIVLSILKSAYISPSPALV